VTVRAAAHGASVAARDPQTIRYTHLTTTDDIGCSGTAAKVERQIPFLHIGASILGVGLLLGNITRQP
jgi:hypothetical protein